MTRDDFRAFHELDIDFSAIDLDWGGEFVRYFCTPKDAEWMGELAAKTEAALSAVARKFDLTPVDPFEKVKAMQADSNPSILNFSDEYYDVLGLENPRCPGETEIIQGTAFAAVILTRGDPMLPQDPNILLSYVNTKLRDEYDSLEALCDGLDAAPEELSEKLAGLGYAYDADANQFKPV